MTGDPEKTRKPIWLFLLLTFCLSSIFYVLLIRQGSLQSGGDILTLGLMWCPALGAFLTWRILKIKSLGIGWRPGNWRYLVLGYLLPFVYSLAAYGFVWLTGIAPFQNALTPQLIGYVVVGSIIGNLSTLGEEIGWRGFLVPQLYKLSGFVPTALISGAIWAAWHLPLLLGTDYNRGSLGAYSLLMFALDTIALSFVYTWLRLKSSSLWPVVLLHTSHNVFVLHVFDPLTSSTALAPYFISETGAALLIANLILAFLIWRLSQRLPTTQAEILKPAAALGSR
jgi:membrane protease YdiL (CAAX protease family)